MMLGFISSESAAAHCGGLTLPGLCVLGVMARHAVGYFDGRLGIVAMNFFIGLSWGRE